jgi:hypothetical protein
MPWLYNEDAALKLKLEHLRVFDDNAPAEGREVPVRYRLPEDELADLTYPIFIIEHAGIKLDTEREHRGRVQLPYAPEGQPEWWSDDSDAQVALSPYYADFPTPYCFDYQITYYARFWTQHVYPIMGQLVLDDYLPAKMGYLNVPQDGTTRSMFVIGGPDQGYGFDEDDKRLFRITWLVRVYTEVVQNLQVLQSYGGTLVPVSAVDLDLSVYSDLSNIQMDTPAEIEQHRGILSVSAGSSFNAMTLPS